MPYHACARAGSAQRTKHLAHQFGGESGTSRPRLAGGVNLRRERRQAKPLVSQREGARRVPTELFRRAEGSTGPRNLVPNENLARRSAEAQATSKPTWKGLAGGVYLRAGRTAQGLAKPFGPGWRTPSTVRGPMEPAQLPVALRPQPRIGREDVLLQEAAHPVAVGVGGPDDGEPGRTGLGLRPGALVLPDLRGADRDVMSSR